MRMRDFIIGLESKPEVSFRMPSSRSKSTLPVFDRVRDTLLLPSQTDVFRLPFVLTLTDILDGKVHIPPMVLPLHRALRDAETGVAQGGKLEKTVYDLVKVPQNDAVKALSIKKSKERKQKKDGRVV